MGFEASMPAETASLCLNGLHAVFLRIFYVYATT